MAQALLALTAVGEEGSSGRQSGLALPCCGQPPTGLTTLLQAGQPAYLCEGRLFSNSEEGGLTEQSLWVSHEGCKPAPPDDPRAPHIHGPNCGHERVLHGDHYDYLVGNELQHVSAHECCEKRCVPENGPFLRSHGYVSVMRHRKPDANACKRQEGLQQVVTHAEADSVITSKLHVNGMCCPSEVPIIQSALGSLHGVNKVDCVVPTRTVFVQHDSASVSAAMLVAALNGAHLDAALAPPRSASPAKGRWLPPWHICLSAALLILSLVHYGAKHGPSWLDHFKWAALAAVALGIPKIAFKALVGLRHRVLDINALMVLATVGALAIEDYTEGAAVLVLFAVASWLEEGCGRRARDAVSAVVAMQPAFAILAVSGQEVAAEELVIGSRILIKPGDRSPADGMVVSGATRMDESMLTGEPAPISKRNGDKVLGGTANVGSGVLTVRCTALAADSAVAKVSSLVEQAMGQQSKSEGAVLRFAKYYTPLVLLTCILIIAVPAAMRQPNLKGKVYLALQVLVTACPCALVLSTPVVVVAGLTAAAKNGILIKGGHILESLAALKVITFDKTGTLTQGRFQVAHVATEKGITEGEMLQLSACLEKTSSHPLAAVVLGRAAAMHLPLDAEVTSSHTMPGLGLTGTVAGRHVAVGNSLLMHQQCGESGSLENEQAHWAQKGTSVCWVAIDRKVAGFLALADSVRPEAASAVRALQKAGVVTAMLTGDSLEAAGAIATAVGLKQVHIHASLLPQDKFDAVAQHCKDHGPVMHIGDGINDAPALAAANVGVAMGVAGAAVAIDAADVALFTNDLRCLSHIILFGRSAKRKILLNICISVVTKVVVLVLAGMSKFTLWGAVLVDVGTALLVILHGMMLMRWRLPQAMRPGSSQNVQCSQQRWAPSADTVERRNNSSDNQACSSSRDSCGTSAVTVGQGTVMPPLGGKAESCSADRQCYNTVAAMKPKAGSAAGSDADIPNSCISGKLCKPQTVAQRRCEGSASDALASELSCCNSGRQCQPQAVAVKLGEDSGKGAPAERPSCCSSKRQCQVEAAAVEQKEGGATDAPTARRS